MNFRVLDRVDCLETKPNTLEERHLSFLGVKLNMISAQRESVCFDLKGMGLIPA